jgi:purine-binding chemotaxis protein CheW
MTASATTSTGRAADGGPLSIQFLRLSLGGDMHAVRIDAVREILELSHITPLPLMPDFVRGVMNLRGAVVPVVDLAARLGLQAATLTKRSCVVIVDVHVDDANTKQTFGALVDAVFEVIDANGGELEGVPRLGTRVEPRYIRSMVRVRGTATPELDLAAILDEQALRDLVRLSSNVH